LQIFLKRSCQLYFRGFNSRCSSPNSYSKDFQRFSNRIADPAHFWPDPDPDPANLNFKNQIQIQIWILLALSYIHVKCFQINHIPSDICMLIFLPEKFKNLPNNWKKLIFKKILYLFIQLYIARVGSGSRPATLVSNSL